MSETWTTIDPQVYVDKNYATLNSQDLMILAILVDWHRKNGGGHLLEIGCGPNMYPILAALPFYDRIYASDVALPHLNYIQKQREELDDVWYKFANILKNFGGEDYDIHWQTELKRKLVIRELSIFDIPPSKFDNISMHFVAEGLSGDKEMFEGACKSLYDGLTPGGKLTAAFMENSTEAFYDGVKIETFPVTVDVVRYVFNGLKSRVVSLPYFTPIREGYTGVVVCQGHKLLNPIG